MFSLNRLCYFINIQLRSLFTGTTRLHLLSGNIIKAQLSISTIFANWKSVVSALIEFTLTNF